MTILLVSFTLGRYPFVTTVHSLSSTISMLANVPLPHHSSSFLKPPNLAKNLEHCLNVTSNSLQTGRGCHHFHSLFQNHFSCGVLGCGRRLPYLLQWGQSFFFFVFLSPPTLSFFVSSLLSLFFLPQRDERMVESPSDVAP